MFVLVCLSLAGCERSGETRRPEHEGPYGFRKMLEYSVDFSPGEGGDGWPPLVRAYVAEVQDDGPLHAFYEIDLRPLDAREQLVREAVDRANAAMGPTGKPNTPVEARGSVLEALRTRRPPAPAWWKGGECDRCLAVGNTYICFGPTTTYVWKWKP